ncbi:hypothetical protein PLICRDRAFT_37700 [Plicaturopsis crispa FD-325 SS-3]|nr:hypothetical protein PLICRDRAFT_37700 [Plicaturopsis crispa FD-325 SS-3]
MGKRTSSSAPIMSPKKKRKADTGQATLDHFFSGSPVRAHPHKGKVESPSRHSPPAREVDASESSGDTSLDRQYAEKLAAENGLDLDTVRKLETEWKESSTGAPTQPSIIDVDLLTDDDSTRPKVDPPPVQSGSTSARIAPTSRTQRVFDGPTQKHVSDTPSTAVYQSLAVDPLVFPIDDVPWLRGTGAPYSLLARTLETLSGTRSRIVIINTLTNTLRLLSRYDPTSLRPALYLLSNSLSPPYLPIELGLGQSLLSKAIQQVSGLSPAALKSLWNKTGDVGDVAHTAKSNVRTLVAHSALQISTVYDSLLKIAQANGPGATKQKQAIAERLLISAKGEEIRFLARTLSQNLRVGAVRTSILTALARAMALTPPLDQSIPLDSPFHISSDTVSKVQSVGENSKKKMVDPFRDEVNVRFNRAIDLLKRVFVQHPNFDHITCALLEAGLDGLADRVQLTVGIPLHPTLGSPTRSLDEIYERLGDLSFAAEFKYDGQRAQIHAIKQEDGKIITHIFSRHLEDMTSKYPDVSSMVDGIFGNSPDMQSFIMDSEIVAIDAHDGSLKSFQELSGRARKAVQIHDIQVNVGVFAFDLMYLDGEILLERPFRERRSLLRERFPPFHAQELGTARLFQVESCESEAGRDAIEEFWSQAVESRCEGLMIKLLDNGEVLEELGPGETSVKEKTRRKPLPATYEPDKRTSAWLKLKKDYVTGLGDSLDLVPIGAWRGNGRKHLWWSPILLAIQDPRSGHLVAVCKCMSGFTDVFYKAMTERYAEESDNCSRRSLWECDVGGFTPDVYFRPHEVWEIRGADITVSPVSVAGLGLISASRGLSLRFPRFIQVREDKTTDEASTVEFLADIWGRQHGEKRDKGGVDDGELIDVVEVEEQYSEEESEGE